MVDNRSKALHRAFDPMLVEVDACLCLGLLSVDAAITPSVLLLKQLAKTCHEHHVDVIVYVIKCEDKFLVAKKINEKVNEKRFKNSSYIQLG
jgi:hypothetical protein